MTGSIMHIDLFGRLAIKRRDPSKSMTRATGLPIFAASDFSTRTAQRPQACAGNLPAVGKQHAGQEVARGVR